MDFSTYLETLPSTELASLYSSPWTCQAVLRSLPSIPQQFVLRLLHLEEAVPDAWLNAWVTAGHERKAKDAIRLLKRLRVLQCDTSAGKSWSLEPTFKCAPALARVQPSEQTQPCRSCMSSAHTLTLIPSQAAVHPLLWFLSSRSRNWVLIPFQYNCLLLLLYINTSSGTVTLPTNVLADLAEI